MIFAPIIFLAAMAWSILQRDYFWPAFFVLFPLWWAIDQWAQ